MPRRERWDSEPHFMYYQGQTIEVFTRAALAKALNRSVVTIRKMETDGVLCHPRLKKLTNNNKVCLWLYTRDQIRDLVELARREGVLELQNGKRYPDRFCKEAQAILRRRPKLI